MSKEDLIPRKMVLTEADLKALSEMIKECQHCRFENVSKEDMDFIKDLLCIYKETRSEVIRWIVKGVVWSVLLLMGIGAYFKFVGKH